MRRQKQLSFDALKPLKIRTEFGGSLLVGKRKEERPFRSNKPQHIVLKSEEAKRLRVFLDLTNQNLIEQMVRKVAQKWNVKIHEVGFADDHIHFAAHTKVKTNFL